MPGSPERNPEKHPWDLSAPLAGGRGSLAALVARPSHAALQQDLDDIKAAIEA